VSSTGRVGAALRDAEACEKRREDELVAVAGVLLFPGDGVLLHLREVEDNSIHETLVRVGLPGALVSGLGHPPPTHGGTEGGLIEKIAALLTPADESVQGPFESLDGRLGS
jgi:hypothetical protein